MTADAAFPGLEFVPVESALGRIKPFGLGNYPISNKRDEKLILAGVTIVGRKKVGRGEVPSIFLIFVTGLSANVEIVVF